MGIAARLTILTEDTVHRPGLIAEHGLAIWIETAERRILFDTGQGLALRNNARRLGVALETADAIVLSHGHYDHTGGLARMLMIAPRATIYLHPAALHAKYACTPLALGRYIGIPDPEQTVPAVHRHALVYTERPTEVAPGVRVTGTVPRRNDVEDTGGPFYRDDEGRNRDPLVDDQALVIDTPKGALVVLGCAHAGVVNTLEHVSGMLGGGRIYGLLGGMHLLRANELRIDFTANAIEEHRIALLGPCHCTGDAARGSLRSRFPEQYRELATGVRLAIA